MGRRIGKHAASADKSDAAQVSRALVRSGLAASRPPELIDCGPRRPAVVSLLTADAAAIRSSFFDTTVLPRIAAFCGFAEPAPLPPPAQGEAPTHVKADNVPFAEWLTELQSGVMAPDEQARVLECFAAMRPSFEAGVAARSAASATACARNAEKIWKREGLSLPTISRPTHFDEQVDGVADRSASRAAAVDDAIAYNMWQLESRRSRRPPAMIGTSARPSKHSAAAAVTPEATRLRSSPPRPPGLCKASLKEVRVLWDACSPRAAP